MHLLLTSRGVLDMLGQVGDARHTGPPRTTSCTVDKNVISFNQRHPSRPDGSGGGNNVSVKPGKCLPKDSHCVAFRLLLDQEDLARPARTRPSVRPKLSELRFVMSNLHLTDV